MALEKCVKQIMCPFSSTCKILPREFNRQGQSICTELLTLRKLAYVINRDCLSLKNENFQLKNFDIFLIFAQNIDCGYTLEPPRREAVLTSTHNLCFGAKIRKIGILPHTPVLLYKSGVQGGIHHTDVFSWCFRWELGEFGACNKTCGGGWRNRTVRCIQEYAQGPQILNLPGKLFIQ